MNESKMTLPMRGIAYILYNKTKNRGNGRNMTSPQHYIDSEMMSIHAKFDILKFMLVTNKWVQNSH